MNLEDTMASSRIMGMGYAGDDTKSITVSSFTFFSGSVRDFTIYLDRKQTDSISLIQLKFSGIGASSGINDKWLALDGNMLVRCQAPSYDVMVSIANTAAGQEVRIRFANNTAASNQTVPTMTITASSYYYTGPW